MSTFQKIIVLALTIIGISMVRVLSVSAVTNTPVPTISQNSTDQGLILHLSHSRQTYPAKSFEIILTVDSIINSSKVGVEWKYPTNLLVPVGGIKDYITVTAGQLTTFKKTFTPIPGTELPDQADFTREAEISVKVNAFLAERNYLSSAATTVKFNKLMEILPLDSGYNFEKYGKISLNWFWKIALVVGIISAIVFIIWRFRKYLNADDNDVATPIPANLVGKSI
ncbi:MAG: hypothetical protein WCJ58_05030 [bacterium]